MTTKLLTRIILGAVLTAGIVGCDAQKAEHKAWVKKNNEEWDRTRLGFILEVAEQQYKVGDYDKCRDSLKGAISAEAPVAGVYVLSAKVELEGGSLELAAAYLKKAIALNATDSKPDPEPYYLMGVVYQRW